MFYHVVYTVSHKKNNPLFGYSLTIKGNFFVGHRVHGSPSFSPSFNELVYPGCWQFDNGAPSKFDDVLLQHGGLQHVLPLAVHLNFLWQDK